MDCTAVRGWFCAHLEGRLPGDERGWVDEHLAACALCRAELVSLQQILRAVRANPPPPPPELSAEQLAQFTAVPTWRQLGAVAMMLWRGTPAWQRALVAAVALGLVAGGWRLLAAKPTPAPPAIPRMPAPIEVPDAPPVDEVEPEPLSAPVVPKPAPAPVPRPMPPPRPPTPAVSAVHLALTADRSAYRAGQAIQVRLTLTNGGIQPVQVIELAKVGTRLMPSETVRFDVKTASGAVVPYRGSAMDWQPGFDQFGAHLKPGEQLRHDVVINDPAAVGFYPLDQPGLYYVSARYRGVAGAAHSTSLRAASRAESRDAGPTDREAVVSDPILIEIQRSSP
ncbi:MAG: zf-HC2 domain-containing protein [Candidatus Omnitrophica bacterium]|nr:zf-HC2 domain-containing protein [Candidatus Omnitrophota bacterium]